MAMTVWTYEQALKKAKELKPNVDYCIEYENAYLFGARSEEFSFGGDGSPVVILKKGGRALGQTEYYDSKGTDEIREFDL